MNCKVLKAILICFGLFTVQTSVANQDPHQGHGVHNNHAQHQAQDKKRTKSSKVEKQKANVANNQEVIPYPKSGEARELGFEGGHFMASTTIFNDQVEKCYQAARGIIMLSKKEWLQCRAAPAISHTQENVAVSDSNPHKHH